MERRDAAEGPYPPWEAQDGEGQALPHTHAYREVAAGTEINNLLLRMSHTDPKTAKGYFEGMDLEDIGALPVLEPRKAAQA